MKINVDICVCLSSTQEIEVPDDYEYDPATLEDYVREQIILPQDIIRKTEHAGEWYTDEFCVQ